MPPNFGQPITAYPNTTQLPFVSHTHQHHTANSPQPNNPQPNNPHQPPKATTIPPKHLFKGFCSNMKNKTPISKAIFWLNPIITIYLQHQKNATHKPTTTPTIATDKHHTQTPIEQYPTLPPNKQNTPINPFYCESRAPNTPIS